MNSINIRIKKISPDFADIPLPEYATRGSSGMDLRAAIKDSLVIESGKIRLVPTNLIVEIPFGYEIQIRPRSGLAATKGIGILNSPGTIDADYRGEIKVILFNFGDESFEIKRGDRIAQMVVSKVYRGELISTANLSQSERDTGGFGHTGMK